MTAYEDPTKLALYMVQFSYGDAPQTKISFINSNEDKMYQGDVYEGDPKVKIRFATNSVGFSEEHTEIDIPYPPSTPNSEFFTYLTSGKAKPRISVKITEYIEDGGSAITEVVHTGSVKRSIRNPQGKQDMVKVLSASPRTDAEGSLGFPAEDQCDHRFGVPKTCGAANTPPRLWTTIADITQVTQIVSVSADKLTITTSPISSILVGQALEFERGFIHAAGVRILIRSWDNSTPSAPTFTLNSFMPQEWDSNLPYTITLVPGCDRTYSKCLFWKNTKNFMGAGIGIPDYNPIFENPEKP